MKALRLCLAVFLALSLFLSPVASLAQAPAQEILQKPSQTDNQLTAVDWCVAGDLNSWNNTANPMFDDGTNGDLIAGDGVYSLAIAIPSADTSGWKAVECGNWDNAYPAANSWADHHRRRSIGDLHFRHQ